MEFLRTLCKEKDGKFTMRYTCIGYDLFFSGEIGCVYIDAFFQGKQDPFTAINCWDYDEEKSRINNVIDFANHIADFIGNNFLDLPTYFANN